MKQVYLSLPIAISLLSAGTASAQSGTTINLPPVKVSGFVDVQHKTIQNDNTNSGFSVQDAAIYFNSQNGPVELMVDLPFSWERGQGVGAAVADTATGNQTNDFVIGTNKAQAWIGYKYSDLKVQAGQFDTIYGFELNDTADLTFTSQGWIYNQAMPVTHTGVLATYSMMGITGKVMAANPSNQGAQEAGNTEYGAQVGWANEMFRATAGYHLLHDPTLEAGNLLDIIVGGTMGPVTVDVEYVSRKHPYTKGTTSDTGTGFLILPTYAVTKDLSVAARYEQLEKFSGYYKGMQWSAGLQYLLADNLKLKGDYTVGSRQNTTTVEDRTDNRQLVFSALYRF